MKIVQRNIEVIHFRINGKVFDEFGVANYSYGIKIIKDNQFELLGLGIKYELNTDSMSGTSIDYQFRDFVVIDLGGQKATPEMLYPVFMDSEQKAFDHLAIEIFRATGNNRIVELKTLPEKSVLNDLKEELQLYYKDR